MKIFPSLVVLVLLGASCSSTSDDRPPVAAESPSPESPSPETSPTPEDPPFALGKPQKVPPTEWITGPRAERSFVMLTGGAAAGQVGRILDLLEQREVSVGLFFPGRWIARNPDLVAAALEAGHVVGNSGWDGHALTKGKGRSTDRSIGRAEDALEAVEVDPRPWLFPPGGRRDERTATRAGRLGYRLVRPSVDPGDLASKEVVAYVADHARPGSIVRLDLGRHAHRAVIGPVIRALEEEALPPAPFERIAKTEPVRWDLSFAPGSAGPRVERMQRALKAATFPMPNFDGVFGEGTLQAVFGYEKLTGLERDGVVDPEQMEEILLSSPPAPPREGLSDYIDIDITRQILFEVHDGVVLNTIAISSGSGATYESFGSTAVAHTPRGDFIIERKIPEWRTSNLGQLYFPMYFTGGYAVHGSPSVPAYPASHGCVRVPLSEAQGLYDRNPVGTPVFVHD